MCTKLLTKYSKWDEAGSGGSDDILISANAGQTTAVISCVLPDHLRDGEMAGVAAEYNSRLSDGESIPRAAETRPNPSNVCRFALQISIVQEGMQHSLVSKASSSIFRVFLCIFRIMKTLESVHCYRGIYILLSCMEKSVIQTTK